MYQSVELNVDGRLLRGVVRTPAGVGPFPTVIFYHGFTVDKVGMQRLHELFARQLVEAGFACVRFDFYGLGESDGDFNDMTLGNEIEEAQAIYHWTTQQTFCQGSQAYLSGHSMGGLIASVIAPQVQPLGMVLWSPALNMYYTASLRARTMQGPTPRGFDIEGLELSQAFLDEVRQMDLRAMARGYNGKVLLIHGTADDAVPVDVAYEYQDIYTTQMDLYLVQGADHQFKSLPWKQAVYDQSIGFLKSLL